MFQMSSSVKLMLHAQTNGHTENNERIRARENIFDSSKVIFCVALIIYSFYFIMLQKAFFTEKYFIDSFPRALIQKVNNK